MKKWRFNRDKKSKADQSIVVPMELSQLRNHNQHNVNNNGNVSNSDLVIRRIDSPLPAVPLPEKKSTLSRNKLASRSNLSASCDNLLNNFFNGSPSKNSQLDGISDPNGLLKANSLDFDGIDRMNEPLLPVSDKSPEKPFVRGVPHYSTNTMRSVQPFHDYEELPDHAKMEPVLILTRDKSGKDYISSPMSQLPGLPLPDNELSTAFDSTCHRERQNPMYLGMRAVSPFPDLAIGHSPQRFNNKVFTSVGKHCACAILVFIIIAFVISLLSVVLVALFYLGVITPIGLKTDSKPEDVQVLLLSLQNHINQSERRIERQNETISVLDNKLKNTSQNNPVLNLEQNILDVITSLNSSQIESIVGILKSKSRSNCRHDTYSIGSSPLQKVSDSGEYYADLGFQITGVTCSSTAGYTASLETRIAESQSSDDTITYKCSCVQIPGSNAPITSRVECRIDYWQCPLPDI